MRSIFLIILLLFIQINLNAQALYSKVSTGAVWGAVSDFDNVSNTDKNTERIVFVGFEEGIKIKNHKLGIGVELIDWTSSVLVPIYFSYSISDEKEKISPYLTLNLGKNFGEKVSSFYNTTEKGGLLLRMELGLDFVVNPKIRMNVGANYRMQVMNASTIRTINPAAPLTESYHLYYNFIGATVGVRF